MIPPELTHAIIQDTLAQAVKEYQRQQRPSFVDRVKALFGYGPLVADNCSNGGRHPNSYRAADVTKYNEMWLPDHRSGEAAISESWNLMTSRIRDAVRNSCVLRKAKMQMLTLVVGPGLATYADAMDGNLEEIDDFNLESDTWFERWAGEAECDAQGERTLAEMQQLSFGDLVETGNSFWVQINQRRANRILPLSYELMEWEQLSRDHDNDGSDGNNRITNGIEYDGNGRKIAYHFYVEHPYSLGLAPVTTDVVRVPASRVIHNYVPSRPSARNGVSWFAASMMPERDLDWLVGNKLTSCSIQALATLVHKSKTHTNMGSMDDPNHRISPVHFGHANIARIDTNDSMELIQPKGGDSTLADFIDLITTRIAMSVGLSVQRLKGDSREANFASTKASHQDDAQMFEPLQLHQCRHAKSIRRKFHEQAVGVGLFRTVSADQYVRQRYRFDQIDCSTPGTNEVEASDDGQAAIDLLRAGLSDYQTQVNKRNVTHWKRLIRNQAMALRYAEKWGVVLDWSKGGGGTATQSTALAREEEEAQTTETMQ